MGTQEVNSFAFLRFIGSGSILQSVQLRFFLGQQASNRLPLRWLQFFCQQSAKVLDIDMRRATVSSIGVFSALPT
jgi:hypothetical protein